MKPDNERSGKATAGKEGARSSADRAAARWVVIRAIPEHPPEHSKGRFASQGEAIDAAKRQSSFLGRVSTSTG